MGSGLSGERSNIKVVDDGYRCVPAEAGKESAFDVELIEVKKNLMEKQNSHPELINTKTVFTPYIDVKVKEKENAKHVQRSVATVRKSIVGEGKLNYKKFEFFEVSKKYPWLLKNAFFIRPNIKSFKLGRAIGKFISQSLDFVRF
jgi:hypothetical protein